MAAGVLLRSIEELPGVRAWVAMVQREVGERLAAGPGSGAYGVPSVLAQLACEVRCCARSRATVFYPGAERRLGARAACAGDRRAQAAVLAGAACARRRRVRAPPQDARGSLALARRGIIAERLPPRSREQVREALVRLGHPADARAERLSPEDFRALARLLEL